MQRKGSALSGKDQLPACAVHHLSLVSPLSLMKCSKGLYKSVEVNTLVDESLLRFFYIDFGGSRPSGQTSEVSGSAAIASSNPDHVGGYQVLIPLSDF